MAKKMKVKRNALSTISAADPNIGPKIATMPVPRSEIMKTMKMDSMPIPKTAKLDPSRVPEANSMQDQIDMMEKMQAEQLNMKRLEAEVSLGPTTVTEKGVSRTSRKVKRKK